MPEHLLPPIQPPIPRQDLRITLEARVEDDDKEGNFYKQIQAKQIPPLSALLLPLLQDLQQRLHQEPLLLLHKEISERRNRKPELQQPPHHPRTAARTARQPQSDVPRLLVSQILLRSSESSLEVLRVQALLS